MQGRIAFFKCVNRRHFFQCQPDIIQSVHQAVLAKGIHFKGKYLPIRSGYRLRIQINGLARVRTALGIEHQRIDHFGRHHDGQNAVLKAIVVKDISKAGGNHAADTKIQQCPRRMFTRGSAAKVFARHDNFRMAIGGLVQNEVRNFRAIQIVTHFVEQVLAKSGAGDGFQELLGNDHVSVDIDQWHGGRDAGEGGESFHFRLAFYWGVGQKTQNVNAHQSGGNDLIFLEQHV